MDYEKKYNEALEKARIINSGKYVDIPVEDTVLEYIFPELKESEDELKWLTKFIEEEAYYLSMDIRGDEDRIKLKKLQKSLAWLKKQKSVGEIVERCKKSWYNEGKIQGQIEGLSDEEKYQQGWHDALEKQVPFDKDDERVERIRKEIVKFINRVYERQALILTDEEKDDMIAWLEKQGEKPQGKSALEAAKSPKQEWSEEDFSYIDELTDFFEHCGEIHQPQENVVKWLKSLKSRIGCEGYCTTK